MCDLTLLSLIYRVTKEKQEQLEEMSVLSNLPYVIIVVVSLFLYCYLSGLICPTSPYLPVLILPSLTLLCYITSFPPFFSPHHLSPEVCIHQLQLALTLTLRSQSYSLLNQ